MEKEILDRVKKLVEKVKIAYVATADRKGLPHIAASEGLTFVDEDRIAFRAWFCLKTVENLQENPRLSLAILNPRAKQGYQLLGRIERIEEGAFLDGYRPEEERGNAVLPQAEHRLLIRIEKVSLLGSGPHSDEFIHE
jgi:predicted pyridoxine 5'-phosphate oxidase superfamily flavin-nucleotide-binding protein